MVLQAQSTTEDYIRANTDLIIIIIIIIIIIATLNKPITITLRKQKFTKLQQLDEIPPAT